MAQTVCTHQVSVGEKRIVLEKPLALHRIFFSVYVVAGMSSWHDVRMSFDDPLFRSFYTLNGPIKYFQAEGADIFQGNILIKNNSDIDLFVTATEILH